MFSKTTRLDSVRERDRKPDVIFETDTETIKCRSRENLHKTQEISDIFGPTQDLRNSVKVHISE